MSSEEFEYNMNENLQENGDLIDKELEEYQTRIGIVNEKGELLEIFPQGHKTLWGKKTWADVKKQADAFPGWKVALVEYKAVLKPTGRFQTFESKSQYDKHKPNYGD